MHPEPLGPVVIHCWPIPPRGHSNRVLSQSLWGFWVLVCTRFVWVLWASLAGMEFDSKDSFIPPTVLLGLLCPWTWGITSQSLPRCAATTPAPKTGKTDSGSAYRTTVCTPGPKRRDQWPHKRLTQTCLWWPGVSSGGMGWQWPAAGLEALNASVHAWTFWRMLLLSSFGSVQLLSHVQLFATPWTAGLPVHHQLPELTQTHVSSVGDAIQASHPLSSLSTPAFNLSQHQGLFKWVSSSYQVAKVLEFQLQHQSFQWIFRTDFL